MVAGSPTTSARGNCYRTTQLLGGAVRFVLSTSGHIAALVNPPDNPKASFRSTPPDREAPANPADPLQFLATAGQTRGSWWVDYSGWLAERSGGLTPSPAGLGLEGYPVQCAAPGTYVHDR